jgi:hypothetical protein
MKNSYTVTKIDSDILDFAAEEYWKNIAPLKIKNYLWLNNGYRPEVDVKLIYSDNYIYVFFKVYEKKIRVHYTQFGSDVWKDSCVELFINPFSEISKDYINIETNAIGTMLIAKGSSRYDRKVFSETDADNFEIVSSVKEVVDGEFGGDFWTLHYKIPFTFFEKAYGEKFCGDKAMANFYKCGDETEYPHYGVWNNIADEQPDFHKSQYFGEIHFK